VRIKKNLLVETEEFLLAMQLTWNDVEWVGTMDGVQTCTVEQFKTMADKEYDAGYGRQHVHPELVIVMKDGSWVSRGEYDGSE